MSLAQRARPPAGPAAALPAFLLGTHQPDWLAKLPVPLFVSHRRLAARQSLPRAAGCWALDSGGFTELQLHGRWRTTTRQYLQAVARYEAEVGCLLWAAPQDWMCEPAVIHGGTMGRITFAGTGLSVPEHQARTVANVLQLRALWPQHSDAACPFIPVLQGWTIADYIRCAERYEQAGIRLTDEPLVGLGSVCRRQHTTQIEQLVIALQPIRLHGFGCKTAGLQAYGELLTSADSLAWSYRGRRVPRCRPSHRTEANCPAFALAWRAALLGTGPAPAGRSGNPARRDGTAEAA